jgi:mannose/fructose/N-acetylgalactosamine-specific phosphotransferase system component IIC
MRKKSKITWVKLGYFISAYPIISGIAGTIAGALVCVHCSWNRLTLMFHWVGS